MQKLPTSLGSGSFLLKTALLVKYTPFETNCRQRAFQYLSYLSPKYQLQKAKSKLLKIAGNSGKG